MDEKFDKRYMRMATIWAENSYCERRKVGALVVKDKMIISDGYNGTPAGFENVCEDANNVTKPYVLHAEANAITKIARSNNNSEGATLYVSGKYADVSLSQNAIKAKFKISSEPLVGKTCVGFTPYTSATLLTSKLQVGSEYS